ncbi:MAG: hypothetical protein M1820_005581 [Bogoriella megaspora]|nr:MAG: hypothetical protein M1820_005581 [Bogoriella megaspora]
MAPAGITATNFSPLLETITLFTLAAAVVGVVGRQFTKAVVIKSVAPDDYLAVLALLFVSGQSAATVVQIANGFGKPLITQTPSTIDTILKAGYAANLLYVISICLSKLTVLVLLYVITPVQRNMHIVQGVGATIIAWTMSAFLVVAFQCHTPETWQVVTNRCIDQFSWWLYFESLNAATDLALISLPVIFFWNVQAPWRKKLWVFFYFSLRLTAVAAILAKLIYWTRLHSASDYTLDQWPVEICTQIIQCLSLLSSCCLYLRPFLEALSSGFIHMDDMRRRIGINPFLLQGKTAGTSMILLVDDPALVPKTSARTGDSGTRGVDDTTGDSPEREAMVVGV